jgi:hypothetical protein
MQINWREKARSHTVAARKELEQEPPNRKRGKRRKDGSETK